jgi:hypothetical protein
MQDSSTQWLVADFFVQDYRISGRVHVRYHKLAGQLNDQNTSFIQLQEVYISNVQRPAEIIANYMDSSLYKRNISAAVVNRREDGMLREHAYGSYLGGYVYKTFIVVPAFEITGYLRLSSKLDMRTVLTTGTDDFIILMDGQMTSSIRPDVTFSGGAILVNKSHIGALCASAAEE